MPAGSGDGVATDSVFAIAAIARKYVRHVAIAVALLADHEKAPAIEARVDGGIGWQVVIGFCRWIVARLVGIGRIDRDGRRAACRRALELEATLPQLTSIIVIGHPAPAA